MNGTGDRDFHASEGQAARYQEFLCTADPPADAVAAAFAALPGGRGKAMLDTALAHGIGAVARPPAALVDFFAALDAPPLRVDWAQVDAGGAVFLRSGLLGMAALTLACLPTMYSSPAGSKPLVMTGQLLRRAPRRLAETARFMVETSRPGGLRRSGEGFAITVKVRLMHAQVRRLLRRSGKWDEAAWGAPVNQIHMAGTNIALSVVFLRGLRQLGLPVPARDAEALLAMWRYSAQLMGVLPELQCSTEAEGWHVADIVRRHEGAPDADCKALIEAVMNASYLPQFDRHRWRVPLAYDVSRGMIGDALSNALGYPPRSGWGLLQGAARPAIAAAGVTHRLSPALRTRATARGAALWDGIVSQILEGMRPTYAPPAAL